MALSLAQGVSVTQTGVVLSTVFIATIVFTPLFGKVTSDLRLNSRPTFVLVPVHEDRRRQAGLHHRSAVRRSG